jgi:hypothetical protein
VGEDDHVSALELIRQVETAGGHLVLEAGQLKVRAPAPLSDELLAEVAREKPAIMVALGAPLDTVASEVLEDIRPYLPASLRRLPDSKLLILVNWSIISAWDASVRKLQLDAKP